MKILHFADLHLGVENYGRIDPQTGLSSRLIDFLAALDQVVDFALNQDVDLVLFCGDAYKSREPSQTHQREFARRIWKLSSSGIAVFLLTGNHDLPNAIGRATSIEIFHTLSVPNVTVANRAGTYRVQTKAGLVQIVALPWARRSALLARDETKNLTLDEINQRVEQVLTERIMDEAQKLDRSLPAMLAAHVYVRGAQAGSERSMIVGHDYMLLPSNVANPAFDYVALGHIHRSQVLTERPPVVYCGSLERIDFSEEEDAKGFYVADIGSNREVTYRFEPVNARRFLTINVDIGPQESDPTESVLNAIRRYEISGAVVRVRITIPESLDASLDEGQIHRALKDAHVVAAIAREVIRERRPRMAGGAAERMTPAEALGAYLTSRGVAAERMKVLLEYGQRLIDEGKAE